MSEKQTLTKSQKKKQRKEKKRKASLSPEVEDGSHLSKISTPCTRFAKTTNIDTECERYVNTVLSFNTPQNMNIGQQNGMYGFQTPQTPQAQQQQYQQQITSSPVFPNPNPMSPPAWAIQLIDDVKAIKSTIPKIEEIENSVKVMSVKMFTIDEKLTKLETKVVEMENAMSFINNEQEIQKSSIVKSKQEVKDIHDMCKSLDQKIAECKYREELANDKILDLEFRSMRENLMFYGIPEKSNDNAENCEALVKELIATKLQIDPSNMMIDRAHRIGGDRARKPRPVVVKFHQYEDREAVRRKSLDETIKPKLRDSNQGIGVQSPQQYREARKALHDLAKTEEQRGNRARIVGTKLLVPANDLNKVETNNNEMDQSTNTRDNILDGLDLEGVSEQEKEEIKRALIASKQDSNQHPLEAASKKKDSSDGRCGQQSQDKLNDREIWEDGERTEVQTLEVESGEDSDSEKIMSKDNTIKDKSFNNTIDDDDETQPPSDQENDLDVSRNDLDQSQNDLDLSGKTLQTEDDTAYTCTTDVEDTSVHSKHRTPSPVTQVTDKPLQRHYRAVRYQAKPGPKYYCVEGMTTEQCAKAIYQLFETYRMKLKEAQRKLPDKIPFGNPVKSGRPKLETLDIRKRGHAPVIIDLSDNDEDFDIDDSKRAIKTGTKKKGKCVEDPDYKKETNGNSSCDESDDNFVTTESNIHGDIKHKTRKNIPDRPNPKEHSHRVGRPRKKHAPVLVEETQPLDIDLEDKNVNVNHVVGETQDVDSEQEDEWLSIKRQLGKQEFENPMQKAKLKGYSIPRNKASKTMTEKLQEEGDEADVNKKSPPKNNNYEASNVSTAGAIPKATRGRKRKPRKEPVTLVEDTQDMNLENTDSENTMAGKRKKRKCFRLNSDSENESVPETQGLDDSPDVTVIEADFPEPDSQPSQIKFGQKTDSLESEGKKTDKPVDIEKEITKNSNCVRLADPKTKKRNIEKMTDAKITGACDPSYDPEEGSQSPVIKRSRNIRLNVPKVNNKVRDSIGHSKETDTMKDFSSNIRHGRDDVSQNDVNTAEVLRSNGEVERSQMPRRGVNRLISRPESKESNVSDDISISSQILNTMIDESGDLYSTQMCGAHLRNDRKDMNQNLKKGDYGDKSVENDSDEDIMFIKEVKGNLKTYGRAKPVRGKSRLNTVRKEQSLAEYLTQVHNKIKSSTNIDIDEADNSAHLIDEHSDVDKTFSDPSSLNDLNKTSTPDNKHKEIPVTIHMNESPFSVKPKDHLAPLPNIRTETVTLSAMREDNLPFRKSPRLTKPHKENQYKHHTIIDQKEDEEDDLRPIKMQDFMPNDQDCDIIISDNIPTAKRQRTRNRSGAAVRLDNVELQPATNIRGGARGGTKERGGRDGDMEEEPRVKTTKKVESTIECPLCSIQFPLSIIEEHAANCDGTVPEFVHQCPHVAGSQKRASVGTHDIPVGGASNFPMDLREESDEDPLAEEEHTSGGEFEDADVQDVIKDIKISPGEEGQVEQCYVCDEYVLKGRVFEQHLFQCMARAKQQQAEVDDKGYEQAFTPQRPEVPVEVRQTRRRGRHQHQEDIDTPVILHGTLRGRGRPLQQHRSPTATVTSADRYITASQQKEAAVSESESGTDTSSWEEGSSSCSSTSDDDDNITLGSIARAGSSSLITGPWNSTQAETQSDGSHTIPDWLKNSAQSPMKNFVPVSMQKDSEYFKKQFRYNEERIAKKQLKRKRKESRTKKAAGGRRKKRRKVKRKKK